MERRCGQRGRASSGGRWRRTGLTLAVVVSAAVVAWPAAATALSADSSGGGSGLVTTGTTVVPSGGPPELVPVLVAVPASTSSAPTSSTGSGAVPLSVPQPEPTPSPPPSSPPPSPPSPPPQPPSPPPEPLLLSQLRDYLATRPGHVSVAVYDGIGDTVVAYTDPAVAGYENASTVKLAILTALVERAGPTGVLSDAERRGATPMISVSDNGSASRLWASLGSAPGMQGFYDRLGMTDTVAGPGGKWGLTRTTAADQLKMLREIAYPGNLLSDAGRATVAEFLRGVVGSQRWGLTGGVPDNIAVELKNGWLPYDGGWVINSIGHVYGDGRDYVMAVYTRDSPSMAAGIETVEGLSALAWQAAQSWPVGAIPMGVVATRAP